MLQLQQELHRLQLVDQRQLVDQKQVVPLLFFLCFKISQI
jgi:hypothetical protein